MDHGHACLAPRPMQVNGSRDPFPIPFRKFFNLWLRAGAHPKQSTVRIWSHSYERRPSFTELCSLDAASSDLI